MGSAIQQPNYQLTSRWRTTATVCHLTHLMPPAIIVLLLQLSFGCYSTVLCLFRLIAHPPSPPLLRLHIHFQELFQGAIITLWYKRSVVQVIFGLAPEVLKKVFLASAHEVRNMTEEELDARLLDFNLSQPRFECIMTKSAPRAAGGNILVLINNIVAPEDNVDDDDDVVVLGTKVSVAPSTYLL